MYTKILIVNILQVISAGVVPNGRLGYLKNEDFEVSNEVIKHGYGKNEQFGGKNRGETYEPYIVEEQHDPTQYRVKRDRTYQRTNGESRKVNNFGHDYQPSYTKVVNSDYLESRNNIDGIIFWPADNFGSNTASTVRSGFKFRSNNKDTDIKKKGDTWEWSTPTTTVTAVPAVELDNRNFFIADCLPGERRVFNFCAQEHR